MTVTITPTSNPSRKVGSQTPRGSIPDKGYSAEDYARAKKVVDLMDTIKGIATNKKAIPIEAEAALQIIKALKTVPVPQLKILALILGLLVALVLIVYWVLKQ